VDVTIESGICKFAYGLGLVTSDVNEDGLIDIYVANDFLGLILCLSIKEMALSRMS